MTGDLIGWGLVVISGIIIGWCVRDFFNLRRKVPLSPENQEALRDYQSTRDAIEQMKF